MKPQGDYGAGEGAGDFGELIGKEDYMLRNIQIRVLMSLENAGDACSATRIKYEEQSSQSIPINGWQNPTLSAIQSPFAIVAATVAENGATDAKRPTTRSNMRLRTGARRTWKSLSHSGHRWKVRATVRRSYALLVNPPDLLQ